MDSDVDQDTIEGKINDLGQTAGHVDEEETPDPAIMPETEADTEATGDFDDNPDALY